MLKHKQAGRRGQIALFACPVDLCDQVRNCYSLIVRDFFELNPEGIFKADAGLVATQDDENV